MGCNVNLNNHIPPDADFVGNPTWKRGPCPACTGETQHTNPETPPVPSNGIFSTEGLRPGCYTFAMETPNFTTDCQGCGDCTNIRVQIIPEVTGARNYTNLDVGCIDPDTCNVNGDIPFRFSFWKLLNCNNISPSASCASPSNPAFFWDHGGAGPDVPLTFGQFLGGSWVPNSWNFQTATTLISEMNYAVPYGAVGCNGQAMTVTYRFTMSYNGNLPLQSYFEPSSGIFRLCKYIKDGGTGPLTFNIAVGPLNPGECTGGACNATSQIQLGWTISTQLPSMESGRIFCNNNAN